MKKKKYEPHYIDIAGEYFSDKPTNKMSKNDKPSVIADQCLLSNERIVSPVFSSIPVSVT